MGQMMGSMGTTTEMARSSPNFMGPMPGETTGASGVMGALGGLKKMTDFASFLGDTPEERADNAKKFAALVKDVGNTVKDVGDSTLMQRMMKEQMGGAQFIGEGQSPSGGISPIPRTFDPSAAAQIMSRLGFK